MAPYVGGGPLTIMSKLSRQFKNGYPGHLFLDWTKEYGNVYQLRLLNDTRIVTIEPQHVKAILATQFDSFDKGKLL
jgi:hypothetical protein